MLYCSSWAPCYPAHYLNLKNLALDSCFHAARCPAICPDHFCSWTPHSHPPPFLDLGEVTESVPTPAFLRIPDMKAVVKHAESSPIYFFLPYIPSSLMSRDYLKEKNLTWPTTRNAKINNYWADGGWSADGGQGCTGQGWAGFLNSCSTSGLTSRTFGWRLPGLPPYRGPGSHNPPKQRQAPVFPSDPHLLAGLSESPGNVPEGKRIQKHWEPWGCVNRGVGRNEEGREEDTPSSQASARVMLKGLQGTLRVTAKLQPLLPGPLPATGSIPPVTYGSRSAL